MFYILLYLQASYSPFLRETNKKVMYYSVKNPFETDEERMCGEWERKISLQISWMIWAHLGNKGTEISLSLGNSLILLIVIS